MIVLYAVACAIMLLWILWILYHRLHARTARDELITQLRQDPNWKRIRRTEQLLAVLYKNIHARRISQIERKRRRLEEDAFVYGEIEFLPFFALLEKVKPQQGEVFYDLGCGSGRAVYTAALNYDLSRAYGIEWLQGLYAVAARNLEKAELLIKSHDRYFIATYLQRLATVGFVNGNFLDYDITDGDVVFVNATCFGSILWEKTIKKLIDLKSGSRVIVTSKKILDQRFALLEQCFAVMSWGVSSIHIYIKQ